jgi:FHA domain
MRKGFSLYVPILIQVQLGPDGEVDTLESTITVTEPLDWAEHYTREYADHGYVIVGPNSLKTGFDTPIVVGRSRRSDVKIDDDSVSKTHASIIFDRSAGEYYVVDENSRNGTAINGEPLVPGQRMSIWPGAFISFGQAVFVFIDPPTLRKLSKLAM